MVLFDRQERILNEGSPPYNIQIAILDESRFLYIDLAEQFPSTRKYLPYNEAVITLSGGEAFDFVTIHFNTINIENNDKNFYVMYPGTSLDIRGVPIRTIKFNFLGTLTPAPEVDIFLQRIPPR